jgi:PadR family transcriptional regulator PadR
VTDNRSDLLKGTLDLLVLKALEMEPMHGWGLAIRIEQMSKGVFLIHQGALFPALQRLKRKGLIRSDWRTTEHNRRARYYLLTAAGHRYLNEKVAEWERIAGAMNNVLGLQPQEG